MKLYLYTVAGAASDLV